MTAAVVMDNRKRPLDLASSSFVGTTESPAKRLQVDAPAPAHASPQAHVNGIHNRTQRPATGDDDQEGQDDLSPAYKGLETYRKEAIFRQMLESRRDLARAERKSKALQRALSEVEERTAAFNHFWDLLVEDVRILFQKEDTLEEHRSALFSVIPFTAGQPSKSAFTASIQERGTAIRAVLTRLAATAPQVNHPDVSDLQSRCHQLAQEASKLRQQSSETSVQLQRTTEELTEITEQLRKAERRLDRLQSRSVLLSERPSTQAEEEAEKAKVEAAEAEQRAAIKRKEAAETDQVGGAVAAPNGHASAASREELEQLEQLSQRRLEEVDQLRQEVTGLRQECERLQLDLRRIPDDRTRETPLYRDLHGHFTHAQQELERFKSVFEAMESENIDLRERRQEFESHAQSEAFSAAESLREQLKSRDADVARLRAQRDDLNAELSERRSREAIKLTQLDEMRQFASSKDIRIQTLTSEVRRLQMFLAAQCGDSAAVESLKSHGVPEEEIELIATLQARIAQADEKSADLQRQLKARSSSADESELLSKLSSLEQQVISLTSVLQGASSEEEAAVKLKEQQSKVQRLQDELTAAQESTTALCDEVEKLSQAYSDMKEQANSKVMDLSKMEDKVVRLTTEKSKADNKYFAAMRAKDAVDNEKRAALRTVERQVQVIEKYAEAESHFAAQLTAHEREVTSLRKMISGYSARIAELERDLKTSRMREGESTQYRAHAEEKMQVHIAEAEQEKARRVRVEELYGKMERELEKTREQLALSTSSAGGGKLAGTKKASSNGPGSTEFDALERLLTCSACHDRYRDKIIIKCLHTFCTACVEARIQTRQRKCPSCGGAFAVSDVQPLYLQ